MKKFYKILSLFILLFMPVMFLASCGPEEETNNNGKKYYTISFPTAQIAGVEQFVYNSELNIEEGDFFTFGIKLTEGYEKGSLAVYSNGVLLTESSSTLLADISYTISNIMQNQTITTSGATSVIVSAPTFIWNEGDDYGDKQLSDFIIDLKVSHTLLGTEETLSKTANNLKNDINSDLLNLTFYYGDVIKFSIYSNDNISSYVTNLIYINGIFIDSTEKLIEKSSEEKYYQATYSFTLGEDDTITFFENQITHSNEISNSFLKVEIPDVSYNIYSCPTLNLINENGISISDFDDLYSAEEIKIKITMSDIWKTVMQNSNVRFLINDSEIQMTKVGEEFYLLNLNLPYSYGDYAGYKLKIENVKSVVESSSDYYTRQITTNNIDSITVFSDEMIKLSNETEYYCKKTDSSLVVRVDNKYSKLKFTIKTNGENSTETIVLVPQEISVIQDVTIAQYITLSNMSLTGQKDYLISFDSTNLRSFESISIEAEESSVE